MFTFEALVVALLVAGIVAALVEGIRRESGAVVVNAVAALGITAVPSAVLLSLEAGPALVWDITLWAAAASFLHSLGMLGLYESVDWWDHLTHTLSAGVLAAAFYPMSLVAWSDTAELTLAVAGATVGLTLAAGIAWEILELVARELGKRYDIEPILVHYGRRDTALDLVFDVVGAVLVLALDVRLFLPVVEQYPEMAGALLTGSAVGCAIGIVALTVAVLVLRRLD
ncbi:hypothetical protein GJ631_17200 [Natronomonas sp. CBA1123]|uniref:hypothetical protein n=1 Tax=Natronomonas sp. CBA1123 TaxID=2668070 RepID=UPI0012EA20FF|nr:hypothetical protein [Natronomonas sp. CBA1123]MUV88244.1 hypothetical protein [Natronomonas sp. CBA1123]